MIPVIFIHRGQQNYFSNVYRQAKSFDNHVLVCGDATFSDFSIEKFSQLSSEFVTVYEHLSTNSQEAELICFTRWFTLLEIMKAQNIDVCLHLDSDVMLYANAAEEWEKFCQFDFTLSHRTCGSSSFFTREGLERFCNFLLNTYRNKNSYEYEKIKSHFYVRQKYGLTGGVCDMTLFEFYHYMECGKIGEMMYILDNSTYDHSINSHDQYFKMRDGRKCIEFDSGLPFCLHEKLEKKIRFSVLHYQGPAKSLIS